MNRAAFTTALLALPALWLGGIWIFDATRVAAGVLLLGLALWPRLRAVQPPELGRARWVIVAWVVACFALLGAYMIARVHLGVQGIDFAIFSQVVEHIARTGEPTTTLAQAHSPNFLLHHFVPVLYVAGAISRLGVPAPTAAVALHVASAATGFVALFAVARRSLGATAGFAILVGSVLASSVRTELFWGIHDETYALGFVGLALLAWLRGSFVGAAVAALACGTCKESFFPFISWFALLAIVFHRDFHAPQTERRARLVFAPLIVVGLAATLAYFLRPGFDHSDKLATLDTLLSPKVLFEKALFVGSALVGSFALGLFTRKGRIVLALALPHVGFVLISGYEEMWRPFGYYALIPSVIAMFAAVLSLESLKLRRPALLSAWALIVLPCWSLCFTTNLPLRDVTRALGEDGLAAKHLDWIPPGARVVADPGAALALLRTDLKRMYLVGLMSPPPPFDFVVLRPDSYEPLPASLEAISEPCHPSGSWLVRCAK